MDASMLPCLITGTPQHRALRNLPEDFLWRVAVRAGELGAAALAELERRELEAARAQYFSRAAMVVLTAARDLKPGNVITNDCGAVRMVVRNVAQLRNSDRVLITFSYTNLVTGEVFAETGDLPVMAGDVAMLLVRETVPECSVLAVTA